MNEDLTPDEQKVLSAVERLGCVNELSVSYSCPGVDVYAVMRTLASRGILERTPAGAVKIAERPIVVSPDVGTVRNFARPSTRKPPKPTRKYFAYLDP